MIAERWKTLRASIPAHVKIVAVSKLMPAAAVREAAAAGVTDVGENYAQEMIAKQAEVPEPLRWHFIGHLQRNKVKMLVGRAALIHAVDSIELAREIDKRTTEPQDILIAVNTGGEAQKSGVAPTEAAKLVDECRALARVRVKGLMTMPPQDGDARRYFSALRELRDRLGLAELSMGTTGDYRDAIAEGSTIVRIGTAIFGERPR